MRFGVGNQDLSRQHCEPGKSGDVGAPRREPKQGICGAPGEAATAPWALKEHEH